MKAIVTFAVSLALGACVTATSGGLPILTDSFAKIGESTGVGMLVVTPEAVIEDSRCPINARCIWAGRLIVRTRIDGQGWSETANLTLGQPYRTHGTGVTMVSAEPGKMAGSPPSSPASLFGFEPR